MSGSTDGFALDIAALANDTVTRVPPEANLYDVADALTVAGIGALVVGEPDTVDGVVSERDLARAIADRLDLATTRAIDIAGHELVWCDASATVGEVAMQMMEHYVRHVLVEDGGRLVGIVSARDLLGAYASEEASDTSDDD
jgi:CBS domain-containing protein